MSFQSLGVHSVRWCVVVAVALVGLLSAAGGTGRAAAQSQPWVFNPGLPIDPQLVMTALPNSGPAITNLNTAVGYNALLTYYNGNVGGQAGLLYSLETGTAPGANYTGPQPVPLVSRSYPLYPISGAGLTTIPEGVFAAWSTSATSGVPQPDYYAYEVFRGTGWQPPAIGCSVSSHRSTVQPAAAYSASLPGNVNVYTESEAPALLYAADGIAYNGQQCQTSQQMANFPKPASGVGAAYDPRTRQNEGAFVVFTCSNGQVAWVQDGGMSATTQLSCDDDTSIAAFFVPSIPKSTYSGIVFFYKYAKSVFYGYLVSNTNEVFPANTNVGFDTPLQMESEGGPGAVYFSSNNVLVVYQGDEAGTVWSSWGAPQ